MNKRYDPKATKSVRQFAGSDTGTQNSSRANMVYCAKCGREYDQLTRRCNHDGTFRAK
jgi:hypothetical protein